MRLQKAPSMSGNQWLAPGPDLNYVEAYQVVYKALP